MNIVLEKFKKEIKTKKIAVLGIGISNLPLIKYLSLCGADITAFDMADENKLKTSLNQLKGHDVKYRLGSGYLEHLKGFDIIYKTPKVRYDIPELIAESERGAIITSEMETFCSLCPAHIFGVTGSDGKTTTTTLIYLMLKTQGYNCWLGGNIGTPLLDKIDEIKETDMVILELSSFQLHTMKNRINTAIVTNLTPNHLDVHLDMDEYADAKKNIFRYQCPGDKLVLNFDDGITKAFAGSARGELAFFSRLNANELIQQSEETQKVFISEGKVIVQKQNLKSEIINTEDIILPGVHNTENYLAAIAAVFDYCEPYSINKVAASFRGVAHRIEFVDTKKGISFYNDSIGSSPTRTIASINSFKEPVILIAGGYDKHIPYDVLGKVITERVKVLVLIGQTAGLIEKALTDEIRTTGRGKNIPVIHCPTLDEAVLQAYKCASEGDVVLLSPASASFDMFTNFEERGNIFKNLVHSINY